MARRFRSDIILCVFFVTVRVAQDTIQTNPHPLALPHQGNRRAIATTFRAHRLYVILTKKGNHQARLAGNDMLRVPFWSHTYRAIRLSLIRVHPPLLDTPEG